MALCDEGYLCEVCGEEVEELTESDLYLRYVLGDVDPSRLHQLQERHIRCNPILAQFIVDPRFAPLELSGPFSKAELAHEFVVAEELRVSRGYARLQEVRELGLTIDQYPLSSPLEVPSRQDD